MLNSLKDFARKAFSSAQNNSALSPAAPETPPIELRHRKTRATWENLVIKDVPKGYKVKNIHGDILICGDVHGSVKNIHGNIKVEGNVTGSIRNVHGNIEVTGHISGILHNYHGATVTHGKLHSNSAIRIMDETIVTETANGFASKSIAIYINAPNQESKSGSKTSPEPRPKAAPVPPMQPRKDKTLKL